ncbi:unnamed protein product [Macrosiphum euphorbiae]|uniref:Uncharacterized protein n=1 Tax=Macrosiphum euphorbiae TaxID=13131 RepID=A0AAV0Y8I0_9HEMI|nr:unnamed protein product [Macrosiphum euphorbiae]
MALRDHNYVIPANHEEEEEVGAPNIYLQDHTYAQQLPAVQIQAQPEEDREALEDGPAPDEEEEEDEAGEQEEMESRRTRRWSSRTRRWSSRTCYAC